MTQILCQVGMMPSVGVTSQKVVASVLEVLFGRTVFAVHVHVHVLVHDRAFPDVIESCTSTCTANAVYVYGFNRANREIGLTLFLPPRVFEKLPAGRSQSSFSNSESASRNPFLRPIP